MPGGSGACGGSSPRIAVHHLYDGDVGERGDHGPGELVAGRRWIQGASHAAPHGVQDVDAGAPPLAFGDEPLGRLHPQLLVEDPPLLGQSAPCAYRMQSACRRDHGPSAPADTTL